MIDRLLTRLTYLSSPRCAASVIVGAATLLVSGCISHPTAPVSDLSPLTNEVKRGYYTVKKGDTLYSIAFRTGKDYKQIAAWNGIAKPYTIYVDDQLRLTRPATLPATAAPPDAASPSVAREPARPAPPPSAPLPGKVATWTWPARGKLIARFAPGDHVNGIQIAANAASPVKSAASGQVVYAGTGIRGYGQLIIVKHSDEFLSAYAHNQQMLVKEGDSVTLGQQIGKMGSTGTNRTKLHFEIRKNGQPVNPLKYLPLLRS